MELVKLGKKGQVSIPQALLRDLGLEGENWLIAEAGENGAIVLRPAAVHPIKLYSDERIKEFDAEGEDPAEPNGSGCRTCSSCRLDEGFPRRERSVLSLPSGPKPSVRVLRAGALRPLPSSHLRLRGRRGRAEHRGGKAAGRADVLAILVRLVEVVPDAPIELASWAELQGLPAKDAPILAVAVAARADLLVTGDRRHFGPLYGQKLRGVRVLTLAEGLAAALSADSGTRVRPVPRR